MQDEIRVGERDFRRVLNSLLLIEKNQSDIAVFRRYYFIELQTILYFK